MKKTTLFARLLAGIMTVFFLVGGGSCSDGSDDSPETKSYTVTFDSDGGSDVASQTVEAGKTAEEPTAPTKEGYTFVGWYDGDTAFSFTTVITADITLKANWVTSDTVVYTVIFNTDGGSTVAERKVEAGKTVAEPVAPTKDGYIFVGWYHGDAAFSFTTPITDNITLKANWVASDAEVYTVIFDTDGGSAVAERKVEAGKTVAEPVAPTKDGCTFVGWYHGETAFSFTTPITADITLTAKWEAVAGSGGEEENPAPGTDPSTPGGVVTKPTEIQVSGSLNATGGGWLESAWIEWSPVSNDVNDTYNVYVRKAGGDWAKIDKELVRGYGDTTGSTTVTKFRADALGLAAGSYDMKVELASDTTKNAEVSRITVNAYDRHGYAHFNGKNPGAYKLDGTLKDGAVVIYLTEGNKSTVKATFDKEYTGIKEITQAIKESKGSKGKPVCIRVIGTVSAGGAKGSDLSCSDMSSAYALGVKEANNVTIEGVGEDATLYYAGLAAFKCKDIEFRNLGLMLWGDDGVSIKETVGAWIHHLDIFYGNPGSDSDQKKGDGSMDLKDDSQFVTMDNIHFWDSGKMSLCGMKSENGPNWITYHHNWFDHSDSRHPRIRTMTVHVYNNYYDGNSKYGVGAAMQSNAFVEYNYFRNCKYPMLSSKQGSDIATNPKGTFSGEDGGIIKSWKNYMTGQNGYVTYQQDNTEFDAYEATSRDEKVPGTVKAKQGGRTYDNFDTDTGKFYYNAYSPDAAEDIPDIVTGKKASDGRYGAGRMNGGDFKFMFNNSVDDTSDVINTELESQIKSYKSKLVTTNVTANSTSGGGSTGDEPVNPSNPSLAIDKTELSIAEGGTGKIKATLKNTTGTLSCESSDVSIATVTLSNNDATVTGVKAGKATITFKIGDLTATCNVEVKAGFDPTTITTAVAEGTYSIGTGDKVFSKQDDGAVQTHNNITVTCKIDSNGANVYAKSSKTPGGVFFKLDSGMTLSFTNKSGAAVTTGFEIFSIDANKNETKVTGTTLDAGTYVIRGTSTSATQICKIKFEIAQTSN